MEVAVIVKAEVDYCDRALELFAQAVRDHMASMPGKRGLHVQMLFELATPAEQAAAQ